MSVARSRSPRCSALSLAAGEPLAATATHATEWLVIEAPGAWAREVGSGEGLPEAAREAVTSWREGAPGEARRRVLFVRRPGRTRGVLLAFRVDATEDRAELRRFAVESHEELAGEDLEAAGDPVSTSLVLVCGHGSRDRCCAPAGSAVVGALEHSLGDAELWISSHQGGHRFAANVLVLPLGVQFGRVEPAVAGAVVAGALRGDIDLDHYRGRTCYGPEVQAAEHAIRVATGLTRADDLRLEVAEGDGSGIRFRGTDGRLHEVVVGAVAGPEVPASCGEPAERQTRFVGRVVG